MRPRIIFFDMEGTLLRTNVTYDNGKVAPSAWTVLAARLGTECYDEEEVTKDRWIKGEYSNYLAWMVDTIRIHRKYGLTRQLFIQVMDSVETTPGVEDAFHIFREWQSVTVLISGGFKYLADRLQTQLQIDHSFCACEYFFDDSTGLISHFNLLPSDIQGKVEFMRLMASEYRVDPMECAFVGDGKNDVALAREVGCSIAFNAQPELKAVASLLVEQPDGEDNFDLVVREIDGWKGNPK